METEQHGERIKSLKQTVLEITTIYELADSRGIRGIKLLNSRRGFQNVKRSNLRRFFAQLRFVGVTRIGNALKSKILDEYVWPARMTKPLLVVVITDGEVGSPSFISKTLIQSLKQPSRRANHVIPRKKSYGKCLCD